MHEINNRLSKSCIHVHISKKHSSVSLLKTINLVNKLSNTEFSHEKLYTFLAKSFCNNHRFVPLSEIQETHKFNSIYAPSIYRLFPSIFKKISLFYFASENYEPQNLHCLRNDMNLFIMGLFFRFSYNENLTQIQMLRNIWNTCLNFTNMTNFMHGTSRFNFNRLIDYAEFDSNNTYRFRFGLSTHAALCLYLFFDILSYDKACKYTEFLYNNFSQVDNNTNNLFYLLLEHFDMIDEVVCMNNVNLSNKFAYRIENLNFDNKPYVDVKMIKNLSKLEFYERIPLNNIKSDDITIENIPAKFLAYRYLGRNNFSKFIDKNVSYLSNNDPFSALFCFIDIIQKPFECTRCYFSRIESSIQFFMHNYLPDQISFKLFILEIDKHIGLDIFINLIIDMGSRCMNMLKLEHLLKHNAESIHINPISSREDRTKLANIFPACTNFCLDCRNPGARTIDKKLIYNSAILQKDKLFEPSICVSYKGHESQFREAIADLKEKFPLLIIRDKTKVPLNFDDNFPFQRKYLKFKPSFEKYPIGKFNSFINRILYDRFEIFENYMKEYIMIQKTVKFMLTADNNLLNYFRDWYKWKFCSDFITDLNRIFNADFSICTTVSNLAIPLQEIYLHTYCELIDAYRNSTSLQFLFGSFYSINKNKIKGDNMLSKEVAPLFIVFLFLFQRRRRQYIFHRDKIMTSYEKVEYPMIVKTNLAHSKIFQIYVPKHLSDMAKTIINRAKYAISLSFLVNFSANESKLITKINSNETIKLPTCTRTTLGRYITLNFSSCNRFSINFDSRGLILGNDTESDDKFCFTVTPQQTNSSNYHLA